METDGISIKSWNLSNWIIKTSEEWLNPVVEKLREELLKDKYLHADETPVQVLNEGNKKNTTKSYMWVYSTSVNAKHGIRIFKYASGRAGDNAKESLKGFKGYLHTDGFSGYSKVKDIHHCLCWAHVRRYFSDALSKDMKSPEATLPSIGIAYCNQLFNWERKFKNLSPEDRKIKRLEKEKTVLEAFWSWVESTNEKVLPKSNIGKALQYALNHKDKLETYLEDGNCVIITRI
ncbi:transposase IS66 family protein [Keratinibaculum paraultunense]|uniref:Transposase IS66 family protein n=1 Tax=Keratinibaculum paraultunense TaxID=1278232 RepID=A0A4R3KSF6_9FIRM|nr:IS66 family transposase [Keratinibaculum paraultunense]QQY79534.1 IS66 family transposase [Keratinibaculum paraultunense]TCS87972.1 transposase IS66 family protein [Keratinibaculum paraultunense]